MKKILITGTAGFIGFHLVQKLKDAQYEIIGLDNINDYYDVDLKYARLAQTGIEKNNIIYEKLTASKTNPSYKFIQADISDKKTISQLFKEEQFDAVIHLAAQAGVRYSLINPYAYTESNVTGFLNILEGCRLVKTKHLVFASTSSVYGLNTNMPLSEHESAEHPVSLYAATKKANEMMAHSYSYLFGLPVTGVRFFSVYGPWGRPDMALFIFTKAILNNQPIQVFNNGKMIRDFTYVEDIAAALKNILEKPATKDDNWNAEKPDPASSSVAYRIVNVGNAAPVKLIDYITAIEECTGKKAIKEMMPMQPGDVAATSANVTDLVNNYNFKPAAHIKDGVRNFVEWFRDFINCKLICGDYFQLIFTITSASHNRFYRIIISPVKKCLLNATALFLALLQVNFKTGLAKYPDTVVLKLPGSNDFKIIKQHTVTGVNFKRTTNV